MSKSLVSTKGYLIQKRAFKNNGLIVTLFTEKGELLSGIVYQGQKKNLALFHCYFLSVYQRDGLSLISKLELINDNVIHLQGESLFCALYVNELIGRLGKGLNDAPEVYSIYQKSITELAQENVNSFEYILRQFENVFLTSLGYGLDLNFDYNGNPISENHSYFFKVGEGLALVTPNNQPHKFPVIKGEQLFVLKNNNFLEPETLKISKWLNRQTINFLLEGRELVSRQLFNKVST